MDPLYPPTALITEDTENPVRVDTIVYVPTLPTYTAYQRWEDHQAGCEQCSGFGCFPCPTGGALTIAVDDAVTEMRARARCN